MTTHNPRDEIVFGSRRRSGSSVDEQENLPPNQSGNYSQMSSTAVSDNGNIRDQLTYGRSRFGSNVSKMKERFQHAPIGGEEATKSNSLPRRFLSEADKSPEVKRKKMTGHFSE
ncbi:hypothetical protein FSP39_021812 [Pinctada imbricata]|uniref:Uncharacterized protein n=1 Tax=Pinctada imbricata TaxID=66713 RepID=A0AA88XIG3_PINIB|nr:hypothetical protein FSP39_021812 [Pinctada imbricata]